MNCKPGDLAIIVRAVHEENVGRIVQCIRYEFHPDMNGSAWLVVDQGVPGPGTHVRDCNLRPVSGLPVTDDIDTEVPA